MATAAVTTISQFSSHQCLKKLSTLWQLIKHISLFEKNQKLDFIFISESVLCFLQLLPYAVSTLLLLCAVDFCPFSSFSCCVMSQLNLTHLADSFSFFGSLKYSFYFLDFLPISSRSATPSPSKTAAGRAGRDRFAGESYTVLGKDVLTNPVPSTMTTNISSLNQP